MGEHLHKRINSRRELRIKQRQERAWELRLMGHTQTEIARQLKVDRSLISTDLKAAYEVYRQQHVEEACRHAEIQLQRLDQIIVSFWPEMKQANDKAANVILKALQQRAKLLGLEVPQKVEVVQNSTDLDIVRAELMRQIEFFEKSEGGE